MTDQTEPSEEEVRARFKAKESALQSAVAKNEGKYKRLHAMYGLRLDPNAMLTQRLEAFIDFAIGKGEQRLDFELVWHKTAEGLLAEAEAEAGRARLSNGQGHQDGKGIIIP